MNREEYMETKIQRAKELAAMGYVGVSIALRYLHFSHKAPGLIGYEVTLSNWTSKTAFIPVADAYLEYIGPITQSDL